MPRYFFHARVERDLIPDHEGVELQDADQAWRAARAVAVELVEGESAGVAMSTVIVVADAAGDIVLEMPVSEAIASLDNRPSSELSRRGLPARAYYYVPDVRVLHKKKAATAVTASKVKANRGARRTVGSARPTLRMHAEAACERSH